MKREQVTLLVFVLVLAPGCPFQSFAAQPPGTYTGNTRVSERFLEKKKVNLFYER
jgi:hypothetical protein